MKVKMALLAYAVFGCIPVLMTDGALSLVFLFAQLSALVAYTVLEIRIPGAK